MRCASCGQEAAEGRSADFIAGVHSGTGGTPGDSFVTEYYRDFLPIHVFLCRLCETNARRRAQGFFWLSLAVIGSGVALAGYAESREPLVGALVIGMVLGGLIGAFHFAFIYFYWGTRFDQRLLERAALKQAEDGGRNAIWTPKNFERLQQNQR